MKFDENLYKTKGGVDPKSSNKHPKNYIKVYK